MFCFIQSSRKIVQDFWGTLLDTIHHGIDCQNRAVIKLTPLTFN
jgi:hypothetical protein